MTKPCVFDRTVGYRATIGEHDDDCTDPTGHRGCLPCTNGHCCICNREHTTTQHPLTCPECVGSVREDITEIVEACRSLPEQAADGEGLAWASARIPGHTAMIAMGPSADPGSVIRYRTYEKDHRPKDQVPPLTVLAHWQDLWATWFGINPTTGQTTVPELAAAQARQHAIAASWHGFDIAERATIARAANFLDRHLTAIAQQTITMRDGHVAVPPEFPEFATALSKLRVQLEGLLHDEEGNERGVDCFECGHQLQRRIRDPKTCRHRTPAREHLARRLRVRPDAIAALTELGQAPSPDRGRLEKAARIPSPAEVAAARLPCTRCDQGGIEDPRPGISWECPSCRKRYTPGEYATAVRRDLLDRNDGDGWTDINLAADAATTLTHQPVLAVTVRKWMDRGKVSGCCLWGFDHLTPCSDPIWHDGCRIVGRTNGQRLVFWPDVAEEAAAAVERAKVAAQERIRKAVREQAEEVIAQLRPRLGKKRRRELLAAPPIRKDELDVDVFRLQVELARPKKRAPKMTTTSERIGA